MKVILQQNVLKLGKAGDIVETAPGYFRNYLQPRNLAVVATDGTLKKREEDLEALKKKAAIAHQEQVEIADKITAVGSIKLFAKAGEGGKLYGKVTNKEIALELSKQVGVEIDKRTLRIPEDIGSLGSYKIQVKLAPDIQSDLTVEVRQEGSVEPAAAAPAAPVS